MPLDSLNAIYLVSNNLVPVSREQIDHAQTALRTTFPSGYDEFMLRFGKGDLRPYDPDRVVAELATNREMLNPDFWDEVALVTTQTARQFFRLQ